MNKKILLYPLITISLFAANIDSQQNRNKKMEQLLNALQKIQKLEQQKTKHTIVTKKKLKPKISEQQKLQKKMDLLRTKIMYLNSLQEYNLQKENNNKNKLISLLKAINNSNILNYKKTTFKLPFKNKITINNSIEYEIDKKNLDTILTKIKTLKSKISKLQTENKVLPLLSLDQLRNMEQDKLSTFQTDNQGGNISDDGNTPIDNNQVLKNSNSSLNYIKLSILPFKQIKIIGHTILLKKFY